MNVTMSNLLINIFCIVESVHSTVFYNIPGMLC